MPIKYIWGNKELKYQHNKNGNEKQATVTIFITINFKATVNEGKRNHVYWLSNKKIFVMNICMPTYNIYNLKETAKFQADKSVEHS